MPHYNVDSDIMQCGSSPDFLPAVKNVIAPCHHRQDISILPQQASLLYSVPWFLQFPGCRTAELNPTLAICLQGVPTAVAPGVVLEVTIHASTPHIILCLSAGKTTFCLKYYF